MVDFLKLNPAFSMHDIMWNLSVPFVKVMMSDATQTLILSEKQQKQYKQYKRTSKSHNRVYTDSKEDLDAFERELGI